MMLSTVRPVCVACEPGRMCAGLSLSLGVDPCRWLLVSVGGAAHFLQRLFPADISCTSPIFAKSLSHK